MDQKQLLVIAYFFPPLGGSGSLRPLKLAKFLPENGWNPTVLTVSNPDWYYAKDPALLNELPDEVTVHRVRMLRSAWIYRLLNPLRSNAIDQWISRYIVHPDNQVGWILPAYLAGLRLIREHSIHAIYSTSAPLSSHLIAYLIKNKTGLPWIADFRDEWYENPDFAFPTPWHRRFHYLLEKRIVQHADRIITAAPGFGKLLSKHGMSEEKCTTVFMGYDPTDFYHGEEKKEEAKRKRDRFTITFSGLFYGSFRPDKILAAVELLIEKGKVDPGSIQIQFIGANRSEDIGTRDLYGICIFKGYLPHRLALEHILDSDVLLLLLSQERGDYVVPSKTFEYIAARVPILASVPPHSTVAGIVRETQTGKVVDFEEIQGTADALWSFYEDWLTGRSRFSPDVAAIRKYDQRAQTSKFASLLDQIAGESNTGEKR